MDTFDVSFLLFEWLHDTHAQATRMEQVFARPLMFEESL